jgi:hypothetical protein
MKGLITFLVAYTLLMGLLLASVDRPSPKAPEQTQMPCFAPDVLGTYQFPMCPDSHVYEMKDI